jgi:hypothetical protein
MVIKRAVLAVVVSMSMFALAGSQANAESGDLEVCPQAGGCVVLSVPEDCGPAPEFTIALVHNATSYDVEFFAAEDCAASSYLVRVLAQSQVPFPEGLAAETYRTR